MPVCVQKSMLRWCNMGNASASYATAKESRKMMTDFRKYIGKLCHIDTCCPEPRDIYHDDTPHDDVTHDDNECDKYKVIFTSGASEANSTILRSTVDAYIDVTVTDNTPSSGKSRPHIIISEIEHRSLLDIAKSFEERGIATVSYIAPTKLGYINPADVEAAISFNTCIICIMHANNETGAINNIRAIGKIAHSHNIPLHCDTVQTFGKFTINPIEMHIDSFCISFHKFHGPPGVGALIVRQNFLAGYKLQPLIFGSQNEGLRGGTENLPGIGASYTALAYTMVDRLSKNAKMLRLKKSIMRSLERKYTVSTYADYSNGNVSTTNVQLVYLTTDQPFYLPNTLMIAVIKKTQPYVCNSDMKNELEARGIVVSVGSACNTANDKASHVLYAMNVDSFIRKGALRISLGDDTTDDDCDQFTSAFITIVDRQLTK